MQRSTRIKTMTLAGMFAALIFLAIYVIHLPIGAGGSYIHFGDALIYLAASVLPLPWAMAASAVGAGLADALVPGGMIWLPFTVVIKVLMCLAFRREGTSILTRRNMVAVVVGAGITIAGYSLASALLFGNLGAVLAELPISLVQSLGSGLLYAVLAKGAQRLIGRH